MTKQTSTTRRETGSGRARATRGALAGLAVLSAIVATPSPAAAYIGPGAALSLLGAFWGVLVAVGAAVAFAVAWPVRRYLKMRRERKAGAGAAADARAAEESAEPRTATRSAAQERARTGAAGASSKRARGAGAGQRSPYTATEA